jgi:hypothetical protein
VFLLFQKSLFDKLNLGSFKLTELKLHLADSTYNQAIDIKENLGSFKLTELKLHLAS